MAAQQTNFARLWRDLNNQIAALPIGDPRIAQLQTQLQQLQSKAIRNRLVFQDVVRRPVRQRALGVMEEVKRIPQKVRMKQAMQDLRVMPRLGYFPGGEEARAATTRAAETGLFQPSEPFPYSDPVPKMGPKTMGYLLKEPTRSRSEISSTMHNPSDEGEYNFDAEVSGKGKPKKCRKCGKMKKMVGGSFEGLKTIRIVAGNAGTTRAKMRGTIDAQGYKPLFQFVNAYPVGNGFLSRPEQVKIIDTTWLIAQYEVAYGLMTEAEAAGIQPTRHFTREEVQAFINSLHPQLLNP